jgi:TfuA protein
MSRLKSVVFLGPSLSHLEAETIFDADFRPPAIFGDVKKASREGYQLIGVIDGEFYQSMAVAPKEILQAMRSGSVVYGAASIGAIRAVELARFGMIGVGHVYEAFRSGRLSSDDEVAVTFNHESLAPASEALVNIRYGLALAQKNGILDKRARMQIVRSIKRSFFPERSWRLTYKITADMLGPESAAELQRFITDQRVDIKAADARLLLAMLAQGFSRADQTRSQNFDT